MKVNRDKVESAKKKAAFAAVNHIQDGFIIGLGSGSTVAYAVEAMGMKARKEKIKVLGVPTSYQALQLAVQHKIPTTTLEEHPILDIVIDGADQIDQNLNLIKGMGAALLREKIVANSSKLNIIIVDENKKVETLGCNNHPVPIEVVPFAVALVINKIKQLGGKPVLRECKGKLGPVISDNGNMILDATFGKIKEKEELNKNLKMIPGVVETGLFIDLTDIAYVGAEMVKKPKD